MRKADLHGGCVSLESSSGPELQLLARQSKSTSCLVKNLGLSAGTHPRHDAVEVGGTHTAPSSRGTPCEDLS